VVTSLHQPFLTLLRTEANKDGRGWDGAFAVYHAVAKKRKPVRQFAEFRHAEWAMLPIRHRFNLPTSLLKKSDEAISCQRPIVTQ
jgi:hypothetical protein